MPISPRGIAYDTLDLTAPWRARGAPIVFVHGITLVELAYGKEAVVTLLTLVSVHALILLTLGSIVLELALRHPGRVASLTLSNAAIVGRQIGQIGGWQALFDAGGDAWNEHMMACRFAPGALDARSADWYRTQQGSTRAGPALAIAGSTSPVSRSARSLMASSGMRSAAA